MVTGPTRRGRQCRTNTCTIHSKNGNTASIATGTSASVNCQSPTTIRARQGDQQRTPIIHGDGCFQNSLTASASEKPRRSGRRDEVATGFT